MASGHYSRLDQDLKPILAKVENQQEEYSSKYATNFFNEVRICMYILFKGYFITMTGSLCFHANLTHLEQSHNSSTNPCNLVKFCILNFINK